MSRLTVIVVPDEASAVRRYQIPRRWVEYGPWAAVVLAVLVVAPVLLSVITRFGRRMRGASRDTQEGLGDVSTLLQETLTGIRIVKAFGMESFEGEKFRRAAERLYHHSTRALRLASISSPLMELIAAIGGAAVLVYGALQIQQEAFSAGQFFKFLAAGFASYSPIRRLGAANARVQAAASAADRVFEILDAPVEEGYSASGYQAAGGLLSPAPIAGNGATAKVKGPDAERMPAIIEGICFEEVRFAYRDDASQFEFPNALLDQEAFTLWDLSIVWEDDGGHWRAGLHGKNLGDEEYKVAGYNFPTLGLEGNVTAFYGPPQTVTATVEYIF